jgi:uncharacterized oxidoreductase
MKMNGNTILVTGGGSGIGRGLAEAFHALQNKVIIAGRRERQLQEATAANPGMEYLILDQSSAENIGTFAASLLSRHPSLNVIINNAGIQRVENLLKGQVADAEATVTTNLLGPIRLIAAVLPALLKQPQSAIVNVSSALAFMPMVLVPTYCATKAAMHSYTQSLRFQLRLFPVQVIEIIPPMVQTDLQGPRGNHPQAMPLNEYIAETMRILQESPDAQEIVVERAKQLRLAERQGAFDGIFAGLNAAAFAALAQRPQ